jgi:hypothetical protein
LPRWCHGRGAALRTSDTLTAHRSNVQCNATTRHSLPLEVIEPVRRQRSVDGGGFEWGIWQNWSVEAEYDYIEAESRRLITPRNTPVPQPEMRAATGPAPDRGAQAWTVPGIDDEIPPRLGLPQQHLLDRLAAAARAPHPDRPVLALVAQKHNVPRRQRRRKYVAFDDDEAPRRAAPVLFAPEPAARAHNGHESGRATWHNVPRASQ